MTRLRYMPPLSGELLDAFKTMPLLDGHVVSLFHTPRHLLADYERRWSAWLRETDKRLWPEWCEQWGQRKKRAHD